MKYLKFVGLAFVVLVAIGYFVPDSAKTGLDADTTACKSARERILITRELAGDAAVEQQIKLAKIDVDPNPIKDCLAGK